MQIQRVIETVIVYACVLMSTFIGMFEFLDDMPIPGIAKAILLIVFFPVFVWEFVDVMRKRWH